MENSSGPIIVRINVGEELIGFFFHKSMVRWLREGDKTIVFSLGGKFKSKK